MKLLKLEKNNKRIVITIEEPKPWIVRFFSKEPNETYQVFAPIEYGRWSLINFCYFPSGKSVDFGRKLRIKNLIDIEETNVSSV